MEAGITDRSRSFRDNHNHYDPECGFRATSLKRMTIDATPPSTISWLMTNPYESTSSLNSLTRPLRRPRVVEWAAWIQPLLFVGVVMGATEFLRSSSVSIEAMLYYRGYHEASELQQFAFSSAGIAFMLSPLVCIISVLVQLAFGGRDVLPRFGFVAITGCLWVAAYAVIWFFDVPISHYLFD